jgi:hypothetical protein
MTARSSRLHAVVLATAAINRAGDPVAMRCASALMRECPAIVGGVVTLCDRCAEARRTRTGSRSPRCIGSLADRHDPEWRACAALDARGVAIRDEMKREGWR